MLILAIESSCDEFSMALVQDGTTCLMMETLSQVDLHAQYGGVVPELASREHTKLFLLVLDRVKQYLEDDFTSVDAIAVTVGPGLSGSLLVGIQVAKTLATMLNKPLIPVQHIMGHLYSVSLTANIEFPYLGLVVSGGHTELIYCASEKEYQLIGATRDDAVGEVYDKVAKKLELPYPGGPLIDQLAQTGKPTYSFTTPKIDDEFAFSFSGLKSAVINKINQAQMKKESLIKEDLAKSFQDFVVKEVLGKLTKALKQYDVKTVGLCGGVSANTDLRKAFLALKATYPKQKFVIPEMQYCGDNAAMIGAAAEHLPALNKEAYLQLECSPNLTLADYNHKYQN